MHFLYLQDLQTFALGISTFAATPFFRQDFLDVFPGLFPCGIPTVALLQPFADLFLSAAMVERNPSVEKFFLFFFERIGRSNQKTRKGRVVSPTIVVQ